MVSPSNGPKTVVLQLTPEPLSADNSAGPPQSVCEQGSASPSQKIDDWDRELQKISQRVEKEKLIFGASSSIIAPLVEKPIGTGPQYKCAYCGDLVFESQLDYHMIICPDPTDHHPEAIAEEDEEDEDEEVQVEAAPTSATPPSPPPQQSSAPPVRTPAETEMHSQPRVGGAADVSGMQSGTVQESDLSQRQLSQTQRKRIQMMEEMKRKEDAECTFQPKIISKASPRTSTHRVEVGEGAKWQQKAEQKMRMERRKQVEAQVYANVTLKPKISRFAQVWSQKQHADIPEGQQPLTVFERLYLLAQQSRDARHAQETCAEVSAIQSGGSLGDSSTPSNSPAFKTSLPQRKIPTSELLYSDAVDRRERLKTLAEHVHQNCEESVRDRSQFLDRSRRYYWQMLDRQVKSAFEEATNGEPLLKSGALEDFLVCFGCVKPPPRDVHHQASKALSATQGEDKRLAAALWRHLDPKNVGHVDCFTLTVFFHVLMGAVDDPAKASASQTLRFDGVNHSGNEEASSPRSPRQTSNTEFMSGVSNPEALSRTAPETHSAADTSGHIDGDLHSPAHSPSLSPSPSPIRSRSGSGNMLEAIFEEESHAANEGRDEVASRLDTERYRIGSSEPAEDERHRIYELLVRFDPVQLRTEFKQIYMHRLFYQAQHSQSSATQVADRFQEVSAPEIDAKSRDLAEKVIEREKVIAGDAGGTLTQHADLMLWRHSQAEARKQERRAQRAKDVVSGCTFQPKLVARPHDMPMEVKPQGSSRGEVLYARGRADREQKDRKVEQELKARSKVEVQDCTFRPNTSKSERSYNRTNDGHAPVPRGFYETRSRLRAANEVASQKRQQREDRMCKITQVEHDSLKVRTTPSSGSSNPLSFGDVAAPLPPVAEDSQMQELMSNARSRPIRSPRGGTSIKSSSSPLSNGRVRGGSPRGDFTSKASSPRGEARQRSSSGSNRRKFGGSSPEPPGTPPLRSPCEAWGSSARESGDSIGSSATPSRDWPASRPQPGQLGTLEHLQETANAGHGDTAQGEDAVPLMYVDVNISPDRPPERIVVREGQSIAEVAADFAAKHVLTPALAQRLHALLQEVCSEKTS